MKNTISALWNGNLAPWEEMGEHNRELMRLSGNSEKRKTELLRLLDDKGKELLEQYENAIGNWECLEIEDAFIKGFCLGAKLTAESLISK